MSEHNITVQGGSSVRLPTAGKYCDRDILVRAEPGGVELPTLTNEGAAADLMQGKQLISGAGEPVTGTFTLDGEMGAQNTLISKIKAALKGKAAGGGSTETDPRDDYQRVEYISSDGGQYIVTDFIADDNTCGIEAVIAVGNYNSTATMGSRQDGGNTRFYLPYPLGSTSIYYGFNSAPSVTATVSQASPFRWQTNFLNSRLAGVYTFDGASLGSRAITETLTPHTVPVAIFGIYEGAVGGVSSAKNMKLYSARCSKGYEIVREYIPCYRKSDGVIGVYEKFTKTFLTPDTGAFTKGADIDW